MSLTVTTASIDASTNYFKIIPSNFFWWSSMWVSENSFSFPPVLNELHCSLSIGGIIIISIHQPINVPTAGAQAFFMDNSSRWSSTDWWVFYRLQMQPGPTAKRAFRSTDFLVYYRSWLYRRHSVWIFGICSLKSRVYTLFQEYFVPLYWLLHFQYNVVINLPTQAHVSHILVWLCVFTLAIFSLGLCLGPPQN
jgi:hypothetical protein